jgi:hypothetical protein
MSSKAIDELMERIRDELSPVDADKSYDDFLDECYSFESVGGIFKYMQPSKVLEKMDPTAYRCGFSDWLDGEDLIDVGVGDCEYYLKEDMEQVRDDLVSELESELSDFEDELEELKDQRAVIESDDDEAIGKTETSIEITQDEIAALEQKIKELKDHVF